MSSIMFLYKGSLTSTARLCFNWSIIHRYFLPKEDAERKSQLLDDDPGLVAKKLNLECTRVSYRINI